MKKIYAVCIKACWLLMLGMLFSGTIYSQRLYVVNSSGQISVVDLATCTVTPVMQGPWLWDMAMCPGDTNIVYGVASPPSQNVYQINLKTGQIDTLSKTWPTGLPVPCCLSSLVCDGNGHLFSVDDGGPNFFQFDLATNTWSLLGNVGTYSSGGDLTYFNGKLYLSTNSNELLIITINPFTYTPVSQMTFGTVWGVNTVSTSSKCAGTSTKMVAATSGGDIYYVDPATGVGTLVCTNVVPGGIYGATSVADGDSSIATPLSAPPPPPVCKGKNVTLTVSSSNATLTYSWTPGGAVGSSVTLPATNTTYTVTGTDSNGCTSTTTVNVVANDVPVAAFTVPPACLNNATQFTNSSTIASGTISTWAWNFGEPTSGANNTSTIQTPTHTYSSAGTYTINLLAVSAGGCRDSITKTVVINPLPVADFTAPSVCIGSPVTFSDQSGITGGNIAQWSWNFGEAASGANNVSTSQNPSHTYGGAGNFNVLLTVTSDKGCQSTKNVSVKINPKPTAAFNSTPACVNSPITFADASTSTAGAITSWDWDFGDGSPHAFTQNPSHTYSTSGTNNVTLIVTSADGCKDTIKKTAVTNPAPVPDFAAPPLCKGLPTNYSDLSNVTAPATITKWKWDYGDGSANGTTQNPTHTYTAAGTYTVVLTVTSSDNCTATFTKQTSVYPLPQPAFATSGVCKGIPTTFKDNSTVSPGTIAGWAWNFGDGTPTSTTQNPQHLYTANGTFTVSLIATTNNGCVDSVKQSVSVDPLPVAKFTSPDTSGCELHCITFTDGSTIAPGTIAGWAWDFGDGNTSATQSPTNCYTKAGQYNIKLVVTSDRGCKDSITKGNMVTVFPTPNAEFTTTPTATSILNPTINFGNASSSDVITWYWYFGDGDSLNPDNANPTHEYASDQPKTYTATLIVTNQFGCVDSVKHDIIIGPDWAFYIPNAFSPNADGTNDGFNGKGVNIKKYEMIIFDRWGNLIFKTNSLDTAWDGRANGGESTAQQDVYVWKVVLTDVFDAKHQYMGHVTLVR